ncbi:MAG: glycine/sarcosine/betaine reductase selenoprotein B family protein [Burkholderiales bacterium]
MVYLAEMPADARDTLLEQPLPEFATTPWTPARPLAQSRVAIISTAGLHRHDDMPFRGGAADYRIIAGDINLADLRLSHVSTNFDRLGFQQDVNTVLPLDRLRELAQDGVIGSVAKYHYSFMGATPPAGMEANARELAGVLKGDKVDAVLLMGV